MLSNVNIIASKKKTSSNKHYTNSKKEDIFLYKMGVAKALVTKVGTIIRKEMIIEEWRTTSKLISKKMTIVKSLKCTQRAEIVA